MRGDLQILGYNLVQWAGATLPWESGFGLDEIQQSKKDLESNMDSLNSYFVNQQCPRKIRTFNTYEN